VNVSFSITAAAILWSMFSIIFMRTLAIRIDLFLKNL